MQPTLVLLTTRQVADKAQVDSSTVRRWVLAGRLRPAITTPGGQHRFSPDDVDAVLAPAIPGSTRSDDVAS